jgi:hypothetical protein
MTTDPWVLYVVTAVLSMVWAATEIISAFEATPLRALRTWGALVLMLTNAFFACVALLAVLEMTPDAANNLLTAFIVAFGWQALVRSRIQLFRPLPGEPGSEGLTLPVDEVYGRIQRFVRRAIDQSLARERTALLEKALALDTATLERQVRLMSYGLTAIEPEEVQSWLQAMDARQVDDTERKMLLASKLLEASGTRGLKEFIASQTKPARTQRTPKTPAVAAASAAPDGAQGSPEAELAEADAT